MADKMSSSQEQYDRYFRENAEIVRDWPDWMKEGARSSRKQCDRTVAPIRRVDSAHSLDDESDD